MASPLDDLIVVERAERRAAVTFLLWNRRLHYYLGLYFLFFCWLFALTGLLLNHPRWEFAQFWPNRIQRSTEHPVAISATTAPLERARQVMQQLDLTGEIQWPAAQPTDGSLAFQVTRPGLVIEVTVNETAGRTTVKRNELNAWGVINLIHTFTGVRSGETRDERDWWM